MESDEVLTVGIPLGTLLLTESPLLAIGSAWVGAAFGVGKFAHYFDEAGIPYYKVPGYGDSDEPEPDPSDDNSGDNPPDVEPDPVDTGEPVTDADAAYAVYYETYNSGSANYTSSGYVLRMHSSLDVGDTTSARTLKFQILAGVSWVDISLEKFSTLVYRGVPFLMVSAGIGLTESAASVMCQDAFGYGLYDTVLKLGNGSLGYSVKATSVLLNDVYDPILVYQGAIPVENTAKATAVSSQGVSLQIISKSLSKTVSTWKTSRESGYYTYTYKWAEEEWTFKVRLVQGQNPDSTANRTAITGTELMTSLWSGQPLNIHFDQAEHITESNTVIEGLDLNAVFGQALGFSYDDLQSKLILWAQSQDVRSSLNKQSADASVTLTLHRMYDSSWTYDKDDGGGGNH